MPPFLNLPFLEKFRCAVLWNPADIAPEYCINFSLTNGVNAL